MVTNRCMCMFTLIVGISGCGTATSTPPRAPSSTTSAAAVTTAVQAPTKNTSAPTKKVSLLRTPDGGIQPQAVKDDGVLHLIYFKGEARSGDAYYVKSTDEGATFTKPIRVNSQPGSVVAAGSVRGAHLAIGAGGRVHVAWMGSMKTASKGDHHLAPMLYARLNDTGDAFEPQRNVIQTAYGLDGGGSIAAHGKNVYIAWHAPTPGAKGEENRRVWLTISADDGKSFSKETAISPPTTGSCGCCGMRLFAGKSDQVRALFRGASNQVNRDMFLLTRVGEGNFRAAKLQEWETGTCPMSTMAFGAGPKHTYLAWETEGQVYFAPMLKDVDNHPSTPVPAPGKGTKRRHPTIASNGTDVLFAWTEGMGWNKGGTLAWQVYSANASMSQPAEPEGRADGVPAFSLISAVPLKDGRFAIVY